MVPDVGGLARPAALLVRVGDAGGRSICDRPVRALHGYPMKKYQCSICGFVYDEALGLPQHGIPAGSKFEDFPDDWTCPECGSPKESFDLMAE